MTTKTTLSHTFKQKSGNLGPPAPVFLSHFRGYAIIGLHHPKDNLNIGGVLRAAGCYGAAMVVDAGARKPYNGAPTDTMKTYRHIPFLQVGVLKKYIPYKCVPVAVDLLDGAQPLHSYKHPQRAFYIFGLENGTLNASVTGWCRDTVYVPTNGSMNLAASVNVVLYDRLQKQLRKR